MRDSKDYHSMTIYKFTCIIYYDTDNNNVDMEMNIAPYGVKVLNKYKGPFITPYGEYIHINELDIITPVETGHENKFVMWSLISNIEYFKEKILNYYISTVLDNIKIAKYLSGYRPSLDEYNEVVKYINKFIKKCKDKSEAKKDE